MYITTLLEDINHYFCLYFPFSIFFPLQTLLYAMNNQSQCRLNLLSLGQIRIVSETFTSLCKDEAVFKCPR